MERGTQNAYREYNADFDLDIIFEGLQEKKVLRENSATAMAMFGTSAVCVVAKASQMVLATVRAMSLTSAAYAEAGIPEGECDEGAALDLCGLCGETTRALAAPMILRATTTWATILDVSLCDFGTCAGCTD